MRRALIISAQEKRKTALGATMSRASYDVLTERRRQITSEGWSLAHDDEHKDGSLADAAACYAATTRPFKAEELAGTGCRPYMSYSDLWPESWADHWWKQKGNRRSNLVKAAALLIAEIERLDRAKQLNTFQRPEGAR